MVKSSTQYQLGITSAGFHNLKKIVSHIDQVRDGKKEINLMILRDQILELSTSCLPGSFAETLLLDQVKYINEFGLRTDLHVLQQKMNIFLDHISFEEK